MGNKPRLINIDKQREGVAISPAPSHSLLRRCEAFPGLDCLAFPFSIRVADRDKDIGNDAREAAPTRSMPPESGQLAAGGAR